MLGFDKDLLIKLKVDTGEIDRALKRVENRTGQAVVDQVERSLKNIYKRHEDLSNRFKFRTRQPFSLEAYLERERIGDVIAEKAPKLEKFLKDHRWESTKTAIRDNFYGLTGGLAAATSVALPVRNAIEFEKSLTNTAKVYNLSKQEMKDFGRELLNLSKIMPVPTDQLGALSYQMAQLGLSQKELLPALNLAVKAGMGLDIPLNEVGQKIGGLKAAFGITMDKLQGALDFINEASNKISATPTDILTATTRIAPLAASEGLTPEQTTALASVLLNAQWQPETVETGIKDFMVGLTNLFNTTGYSSSKAKAVQKLSMNRSRFEQYLKQDFVKAVEYFLESARGAGDRGLRIDNLMYEIFGQQHFSKLLTMLGDTGWGKFKELMDMYNKKTYFGSLEQEYKRVSETAASALTILQNNFKALQISIGDTLLPTVKQLFVWSSKLFGSIQAWTSKEANKPLVEMITTVGGLTAAYMLLNPALKLAGNLLDAFKMGAVGKYGIFAAHVAGAMALKQVLDDLIESPSWKAVTAALAAGGISTLIRHFGKGESWKTAVAKSIKTAGITGGGVMLMDTLSMDDEKKKQVDAQFNNLVSNTTVSSSAKLGSPGGGIGNLDKSTNNEYNTTKIYNDNRVITINAPSHGFLQNIPEVTFNDRPKGFDQ